VKSDQSAEVLHHFRLGHTIGFQAAVGAQYSVEIFHVKQHLLIMMCPYVSDFPRMMSGMLSERTVKLVN